MVGPSVWTGGPAPVNRALAVHARTGAGSPKPRDLMVGWRIRTRIGRCRPDVGARATPVNARTTRASVAGGQLVDCLLHDRPCSVDDHVFLRRYPVPAAHRRIPSGGPGGTAADDPGRLRFYVLPFLAGTLPCRPVVGSAAPGRRRTGRYLPFNESYVRGFGRWPRMNGTEDPFVFSDRCTPGPFLRPRSCAPGVRSMRSSPPPRCWTSSW